MSIAAALPVLTESAPGTPPRASRAPRAGSPEDGKSANRGAHMDLSSGPTAVIPVRDQRSAM